MDPILAVNFVFCSAIFILGILGYVKTKKALPLYNGIAFALFGVSHLVGLLGIKGLTDYLLITRTIGYLLVIFAWATYLLRAAYWHKALALNQHIHLGE